MTQQDNWQQEMDHLAQRQDQLERQQRETTTRVDALKRDVDSRIDSLRREIDRQFRDRELRVKRLERFRDFIESLIMYVIVIGCAVALVISMVIIIIQAREASQESGQPEERSFSSMNAHRGQPGEQAQPGPLRWDTFLRPQSPNMPPPMTVAVQHRCPSNCSAEMSPV